MLLGLIQLRQQVKHKVEAMVGFEFTSHSHNLIELNNHLTLVDVEDTFGRTPLVIAIRRGMAQMVSLLCHVIGCKTDIVNHRVNGHLPIHEICLQENPTNIEMLKLLLRLEPLKLAASDESTTSPFGGSELKREDAFSIFTQLTSIAANGWTPLHYASHRGDWRLINLILSLFTSFTVDSCSSTLEVLSAATYAAEQSPRSTEQRVIPPLHLAINSQSPDTVALLLKHSNHPALSVSHVSQLTLPPLLPSPRGGDTPLATITSSENIQPTGCRLTSVSSPFPVSTPHDNGPADNVSHHAIAPYAPGEHPSSVEESQLMSTSIPTKTNARHDEIASALSSAKDVTSSRRGSQSSHTSIHSGRSHKASLTHELMESPYISAFTSLKQTNKKPKQGKLKKKPTHLTASASSSRRGSTSSAAPMLEGDTQNMDKQGWTKQRKGDDSKKHIVSRKRAGTLKITPLMTAIKNCIVVHCQDGPDPSEAERRLERCYLVLAHLLKQSDVVEAIDEVDALDNNALHYAADVGDPVPVALLHAMGANSTARNHCGHTALDVVKAHICKTPPNGKAHLNFQECRRLLMRCAVCATDTNGSCVAEATVAGVTIDEAHSCDRCLSLQHCSKRCSSVSHQHHT
eukprot:GHVN01034159.1.p1 GENE.GHVN01034159.1~~GHVN01034159.1.p1  ORF type:complete len:629 (+),score=134.11 GHVN01034159.1:436-2322(+)